MANISDASGRFTIHAQNLQTIKEIIHLMQYLEIGEYCTYFTDFHQDDNQFDSKIIELDNCQYEFETDFSASGRWTYQTNIERMADWIMCEVKHQEDPQDSIILNHLVNEEYSIEFEYTDYEPGCEVFADMLVLFEHHKGDEFNKNKVNVCECNDIEKTVVNFANKMGYSFDEVMYELYLWGDCFEDLEKERQEEIIEELNPQISAIEAYYGKSFAELMATV